MGDDWSMAAPVAVLRQLDEARSDLARARELLKSTEAVADERRVEIDALKAKLTKLKASAQLAAEALDLYLSHDDDASRNKSYFLMMDAATALKASGVMPSATAP